MRSRLSRLLRIAPSRELRSASLANSLRAETLEKSFVLPAAETESVGHDAELTAHDEAVFLLHTAAEVEHDGAVSLRRLFAWRRASAFRQKKSG